MTDTVEIPSRVNRKLKNRNGDEWHEYRGEPLFNSGLDHIKRRFQQMNRLDWKPVAGVRGTNDGFLTRAKIRTHDIDAFKSALRFRISEVTDEYGAWVYPPLQPDVWDKGPRKTVINVKHRTGRAVSMGGRKYKQQAVMLPIRDYEGWLYQVKAAGPVLRAFHEDYPY